MPKFITLILGIIPALLLSQNGKMYNAVEQGPYLYVYHLNQSQARFAVDHSDKLDSQLLYTKEVFRIPYDSMYKSNKGYRQLLQSGVISPNMAKKMDLREHGYYLVVDVRSPKEVRVFLRELPYFNTALYQIDKEYAVYVSDTAGVHVSNAEVFLDDEPCLYDPSVGGYLVKNKLLVGKLLVRRGNQFLIKHLYSNTKIKKNAKPDKDKYNYDKHYDGYIVTNKPIYKKGDTIFWKAFLVKPNANGFRRKLKFALTGDPYNRRRINEIKVLKSDDRGAYHGHFVVVDSFSENHTYHLTASIPGLDKLKSIPIRVENYDLNDIEMKVWASKKTYQPGEDVKILIKAEDKNGLPLLDARLESRFWVVNIDYTESDSAQIPDHKFKNFYHSKIQTNSDGTTEITIDADSFIHAQGSYSGEIVLTTSDNKTKRKSVTFTTTTERNRSEIYIANDSLYVNHYFNQKQVKRPFRIETFGEQYLISDSVVYSPIAIPLGVNTNRLNVYRESIRVYNSQISRPYPKITGRRTFDSIYVSFKTTDNSRIYYRIYQNNNLVASGNDTVLNYRARDLSKHSYHMNYAILQNHVIRPYLYTQSFHLAEKQMLMEVKQPNEIYPGQKVDVEIRVTDVKKKPLKKVNLTAYAVNSQIPGIKDPIIPYLGKVKSQKALFTKAISLGYCGYQKGLRLKPWMVTRFSLRENPYYELIFPKDGYTVLIDTVADSTTQVQLFITKGDTAQNVIISTQNGKIIYSDQYGGYSDPFLVRGNTVTLKIRTLGHLIELPSIKITPFVKNFIGIQIDSLSKEMVSKRSELILFNDSIQKILADHTLAFRINPRHQDTLLVYRNGQLIKAYPRYFSRGSVTGINTFAPNIQFKSEKIMSARGQRNTAATDMYYIYGPVDSGDLIEMRFKNHFGHEFIFSSKQNEGLQQTFTLTGQTKTIHKRNLQEKMLIQNRMSNARHYTQLRKIWFNPFPKPIPPDTSEIKVHRPYVQQFNLSKYRYSNYSPGYRKKTQLTDRLDLRFFSDFRYARKIWLFDVTDSSLSHLRSNQQRGTYFWKIKKYRHQASISSTKLKRNHKYAIFIQSGIDTTWAIKRITIDTMSHLFYVFDSSEVRNLSGGEYFAIDRMAKILGRTPMTPFKDTATLGEISINRYATKNNITQLEGLVIGPNIQYPINKAFVVMEQNGYFKHGAWTNKDGRFLIQNLKSGTYMLKIKADNYHYWLHYSLQIIAGKNHLALIKLKPFANMKYQNLDYINTENASYELMDNAGDGATYSYSINESSIQKVPQRLMDNSIKANGVVTIRAAKSKKIGAYKDESLESIEKTLSMGYETEYDKDGISDLYDKNKELRISRDTIQLAILANDPQANRTRTVFRDYAYWIPNLTTDKNGVAKFSVTYPDNITTWINYFPAMDNCRHSGLKKHFVKSYKPITARLYFPKFLTEGDVLKTKTLIANYTKTPVAGEFYYFLNGKKNATRLTLENYFTKIIELEPAVLGESLSFESGFKLNSGYMDAERRTLKIIPASVITGVSDFRDLLNDTSFNIKWRKGDVASFVTFYNSKLHSALSLFESFDRYYYSDNQTQINILESLLIKEKLSEKLDLGKDYSQQIKKLMKSIAGSQNPLGWFGYFKSSRFQNKFLTARMAEVFFRANEQEYDNNTYYNACTWMQKQLKNSANEERIAMLYSLKKCNRSSNFKNELARINPKTLSTSGKLRFQFLSQKVKGTSNVLELKKMLEATPLGNVQIPGSYYKRWCKSYFDASNNSFLAWEVLYTSKTESQTRKKLIEAMLENPYGNAYSRALAIQAFVTEYSLGKNLKFMPDLMVNGKKLVARDYPATYEVRKNEVLKIDKKGVQVFMVSDRSFRTYYPVSDLQEFSITTKIGKVDSNVYRLKTGEDFTLTVNVLAKTNQGQVVIEIPIPAGCSYGEKRFGEGYNEIHREFREDRVLIYLNSMNFGNHTYYIPLRTLFKGTFNTASARVSQLDYSDKASYTLRKKFVIED
jgi:hypothetical protein